MTMPICGLCKEEKQIFQYAVYIQHPPEGIMEEVGSVECCSDCYMEHYATSSQRTEKQIYDIGNNNGWCPGCGCDSFYGHPPSCHHCGFRYDYDF